MACENEKTSLLQLYCVSVAAITVFGCQLSQLTVLLIAIDRLTAIKWPLDYKNKVSERGLMSKA